MEIIPFIRQLEFEVKMWHRFLTSISISDLKRNGILLTRCWTLNCRYRTTRNNCVRISQFWNWLFVSFCLGSKSWFQILLPFKKSVDQQENCFDEQNETKTINVFLASLQLYFLKWRCSFRMFKRIQLKSSIHSSR